MESVCVDCASNSRNNLSKIDYVPFMAYGYFLDVNLDLSRDLTDFIPSNER